MEIEVLYEKCRALISIIGGQEISDDDRSTLIWILEDYFVQLGEAIEKSEKK